MTRPFFTLLLSLVMISILTLSSVPTHAYPVTVQDQQGVFTMESQPQRIVVLEYSFAGALALLNITPVGIADDNDPHRLLPQVRRQLGHWTSVGSRAQPSLEVIAQLAPDLIIADPSRHAAIAKDLEKIAPTLMLASRRESYQNNLASAQVIADVVGRGDEMAKRLSVHQQRMASYRQQLNAMGMKGKTALFGSALEKVFSAHPNLSYAGGVIKALGFNNPAFFAQKMASQQINLEQFLAVNPDVLFYAKASAEPIINQWQTQPLWQFMSAPKSQTIFVVDGQLWSRSRSILAAELIAKQVVDLLSQSNHEG